MIHSIIFVSRVLCLSPYRCHTSFSLMKLLTNETWNILTSTRKWNR
jgi:hypothetical protein